MTQGIGGTYRGSVVDDADPEQRNRLRVIVPDILGLEEVWAEPSFSHAGGAIPGVGEDVWVSFRAGDTDEPVWQSEPEESGEPTTHKGYIGKYRGVVYDNADPEERRRLLVAVPEVFDDATVWATDAVPGGSADDPLPEVGAGVWVEFEYGDAQYPTWVGVS